MAAVASSPASEDMASRSVISPEELSKLLDVIQHEDMPLVAISRSFRREFTAKQHFRVCCALTILLRDFLLTEAQRLTAYFLLCDLYREESSGVTPFVPVFLSVLDSQSSASLVEQKVARMMLLAAPSDRTIGEQSPRELLKSIAMSKDPIRTTDVPELARVYQSLVPTPPTLRRIELRPVVLDPSGYDAKQQARVVQALRADTTSDPARAPTRAQLASAEASATAPERPITSSSDLPAPQPSSAAAVLRLDVAGAASATEPPRLLAGIRSIAAATAAAATADAVSRASAAAATGASVSSSSSSSSSSSAEERMAATDLRGGLARLPPAMLAAAVADSPSTDSLSALDLFAATGLRPRFARPPPPLIDAIESEFVWIHPAPSPPILWETTMCRDAAAALRLRLLIAKAHTTALDASEIEEIKSRLTTDRQAVFDCGLTPKALPYLVEHNPVVAVDCLSRLTESSQIDDFLSALVTMSMSLHSMEVVNRMSTLVKLPRQFLHLYISNCITSCNSIPDKYLQSRLVRLVCVFLSALIKAEVIDFRDLFVEVQAFCVEFSKIKEASQLFKTLKALSSGEEAPSPT